MYLTENDQQEMIKLMLEYIDLSNNGEITSPRTERIMNKFFTEYADNLIAGVIHMPKYSFWQKAEADDLMQEGRMALILSIHKNQWDAERGSIFNFFTTVVIRCLINYTRKLSKRRESETDIDNIYNNSSIKYNQNFDKTFLVDDIFQELEKHFEGKKKFIKLTKLLEQYYFENFGKKFIKKHFIEYAKAYNLSPAITNTFFLYVKNLVHSKNKEVRLLLNFDDEEYNG